MSIKSHLEFKDSNAINVPSVDDDGEVKSKSLIKVTANPNEWKMDYKARRMTIFPESPENNHLHVRRFRRSLSATASMPELPQQSLKQFLTLEKVPHLDHYRQSVDFGSHGNLSKSKKCGIKFTISITLFIF